MAVNFDPNNPEGFALGEPAKVLQKLTRFAEVGASRLHFLFDFDRTLTTSKHTGEDITTWQILHALLPEEGRRTDKEIRGKYLAIETAGQLSHEDSHTWSTSVLELYREHGTNIREVEKAVKHIRLRDGARELFETCEKASIPTVILSAGIRDVIDLIARQQGINPTVVLSIKLELADDGRIIGWDRGSMVHVLNKREKGNLELSRIRKERPFTVLIGDSVEDSRMVAGRKDVLRIRVCDRKKEDCPSRTDYLQQSFKAGYDMVVEEDLEPLVRLTRWLVSPTPPRSAL